MNQKLSNEELRITPQLRKVYDRGARNYNINIDDVEYQVIRISEGCPNNCSYCRESIECGTKPVYFEIPEITKNNVKILDMNLIYKPKVLDIIKHLGQQKVNSKVVYYELVCGIDYRYLTQQISDELKKSRFINIRIAWDYGFSKQKDIKKALDMLKKSGYAPKDIMVFVLCNWKIPYKECCLKLESLKIWNVQVDDCYFDNQISPNIKPIHWDIEQIKNFRKNSRRHNQLINHAGIDVEYR